MDKRHAKKKLCVNKLTEPDKKLVHSGPKDSFMAERKPLTLNPLKLNMLNSKNAMKLPREELKLTCLQEKCSVFRFTPQQNFPSLGKNSSRISKIEPLHPKPRISIRTPRSSAVLNKEISHQAKDKTQLFNQRVCQQMTGVDNCILTIPSEVRFPLGKDVLKMRSANNVELSNTVSAKFIKFGKLESSTEKSDVLNSQRKKRLSVIPVKNQNITVTPSNSKNFRMSTKIISQRKELFFTTHKSINSGNSLKKAPNTSFGIDLYNSKSFSLKGEEVTKNCDSMLKREDCGQNTISCNSSLHCKIPNRTYGNKNAIGLTTAEKVFKSIKLRQINDSGQQSVMRASRKRKLFNSTDSAESTSNLQNEKEECSFDESNVSYPLKGFSNKLRKDNKKRKPEKNNESEISPKSSENVLLHKPGERNLCRGTKRRYWKVRTKLESEECALDVEGNGKEEAGRQMKLCSPGIGCTRDDAVGGVREDTLLAEEDELRSGDGSELWPEAVPPEQASSPPSYLELEEPPLGFSRSLPSTPTSSGTQVEARIELSFLDNVISKLKSVTVEGTRKKIIKEIGSLERALRIVEIFTQTSSADFQKKCSELKKNLVSIVSKVEKLVSSCEEFHKSFLTKMADLNSIMTRVSRDVDRDLDAKMQVLSEVGKLCNERRIFVREDKFLC